MVSSKQSSYNYYITTRIDSHPSIILCLYSESICFARKKASHSTHIVQEMVNLSELWWHKNKKCTCLWWIYYWTSDSKPSNQLHPIWLSHPLLMVSIVKEGKLWFSRFKTYVKGTFRLSVLAGQIAIGLFYLISFSQAQLRVQCTIWKGIQRTDK